MKNNLTSRKVSLFKAFIALVAAAAIIGFLYWYTGYRPGFGWPVDVGKDAFFKEKVVPILKANADANDKAIESLKEEIHRQFEAYRGRVPAFTDDITGIGNKSKITWEALRQMASDDKARVKRHVTGKFEMHVVSATGMQDDLEKILKGFRKDIEANNNRMLVDIEAAVEADPRFSMDDVKIPDTFREKIETGISQASLQAGKDAVVLSVFTLLTSYATEEAARALVAAVLPRVAASLAASMGTTAAASGGATVAGGAGGGGVGSAGGPAGALIGVGVGLVVGFVVDYIMTERMEAKLNKECASFLTKAESVIVESDVGLVAGLEKALEELNKIREPIIRKQIESLP